MDSEEMRRFIVEAKARCYVGAGVATESSRTASHDIAHASGPWRYLDSYYGGTDFSGQEVVWLDDQPVWAMNYYGTIVDPARIDAVRAGAVIKAALSSLYRDERRFLGGHIFDHPFGRYVDINSGDLDRFTGREHIDVGGKEAYLLVYFGGRITS